MSPCVRFDRTRCQYQFVVSHSSAVGSVGRCRIPALSYMHGRRRTPALSLGAHTRTDAGALPRHLAGMDAGALLRPHMHKDASTLLRPPSLAGSYYSHGCQRTSPVVRQAWMLAHSCVFCRTPGVVWRAWMPGALLSRMAADTYHWRTGDVIAKRIYNSVVVWSCGVSPSLSAPHQYYLEVSPLPLSFLTPMFLSHHYLPRSV